MNALIRDAWTFCLVVVATLSWLAGSASGQITGDWTGRAAVKPGTNGPVVIGIVASGGGAIIHAVVDGSSLAGSRVCIRLASADGASVYLDTSTTVPVEDLNVFIAVPKRVLDAAAARGTGVVVIVIVEHEGCIVATLPTAAWPRLGNECCSRRRSGHIR